MKALLDLRGSLVLAALLLLSGCASATQGDSRVAAAAVREQALGGLPCHPLVYRLDLSILTYQLYPRTLVWPFDSHYEASNGPNRADRRR